MSSRVIIVSNRLPVTIAEESGELTAKRSVGGLATALAPVLEQYDTLWVGWTGMRRSLKKRELKRLHLSKQLVPVDLTASLVRRYYDRAANGTIWPSLLHFSPLHPCSEEDWQALVEVTRRFAKAIKSISRPGDVIWIHDYHFMLLPQILRETGVKNRIGFFLHTPFPETNFLEQLPYHRQLLDSLGRSDLLGLQTERDVARFMNSFRTFNPLSLLHAKVRAFPIGIDYAAHSRAGELPQVLSALDEVKDQVQGKKVIYSISRLDYVKGIVTQLEGVEKLLDSLEPAERQKTIYKLVVSPSRENLREYRMLKAQIRRTVLRINKKLGTEDWQPIDYSPRTYAFHENVAWFQMADVCLVAPWADGMNLVAKEYVAAHKSGRGMVVLSHTIGAAFQLKHAVLVDPLDVDSIALGLRRALDMPHHERKWRWRNMLHSVKGQDIFWWTDFFLRELMPPAPQFVSDLENTPKYTRTLTVSVE